MVNTHRHVKTAVRDKQHDERGLSVLQRVRYRYSKLYSLDYVCVATIYTV